ncbi:MAG: DUF2865 domain-containing protein [Hyphomicrobiaceae bacterium]
MYSVLRRGLSAIAFSACLVLSAAPASAQGFFQNLFGLFSQPTPRRQAPPSYVPPPDYRQRPLPAWNGSVEKEAPSKGNQRPRSGHYRTLCVRTCDGFYWPINFRASRESFHHDANVCKSSCTSPAELFYHDNSSGDPKGMVDLAGRAYSRLPTAFKYRKVRIPGCTCKPVPWSQSELNRHAQYAAAAKAGTANPGATAENKAAQPTPVATDGDAPEKAEPISGDTPSQQASEVPIAAIAAPLPRPARRISTRESDTPASRASRSTSRTDRPNVRTRSNTATAAPRQPQRQISETGETRGLFRPRRPAIPLARRLRRPDRSNSRQRARSSID